MAVLLGIVAVAMLSINAAAKADVISETYNVPDGSFEKKVNYLRDVLPEGWYWNEWSEDDLGDTYILKKLKVNGQSTTISTKPCKEHDSKTERESCNDYWEGKYGTQCCGFARMMFKFVWGYHTSSSKVIDYAYPASIDYLDSVKPGDMIWTGNHYIFVLAVDGDNFRVVHCNNDHKCGIQWDAIYTKDLIASRMKSNGKGYVTVPSTRTDEPEVEPNWVNYEVLWDSGLKMRVSASTSATTVEVMPKGTIFKADMNRTATANGYTWAYSQMEDGTSGWVAISNPEYCKEVTDNTWTLDYYIKAAFMCTQKTLKKEPYADAEDVREMSGNETVVSVAAYRNKYGNLWYDTVNGGFVNENNITKTGSVADCYCDEFIWQNAEIGRGYLYSFDGEFVSHSDSIRYLRFSIKSKDGGNNVDMLMELPLNIIELNTPVDLSALNEVLYANGYNYLDELPIGEYECELSVYNYEDDCIKNVQVDFSIEDTSRNYPTEVWFEWNGEKITSLETYAYDGGMTGFTVQFVNEPEWLTYPNWEIVCDDESVARVEYDYSNSPGEITVYGLKAGETVITLTSVAPPEYRVGASLNVVVVKCEHEWTSIGCIYPCKDGEEWWESCNACGEILATGVGPIADHDFDEWYILIEPTETKPGEKDRICKVCGGVELVEIPPLGCQHKNVTVTPAVEATCTTDGKTEGSYCASCNAVIVAQTTIPATGHDSGKWIVVTEATTTQNGLKELRCTRCGYVLKSEAIPKVDVGNDDIPDPVVQTINAKKGETVTLNVYVNTNDAVAAQVQVSYDDSVFEFVSSDCEGGQSNNGLYMLYSLTDIINGKIGTITLKIRDTADDGVYLIMVSEMSASDINENLTGCKAAVDKVKVASRLPGDANEDGIVDIRDIVRLAKYLGGYNVTINEANSNVNGDTVIDIRDIVRFAKYLGGYDVQLQ